MARRRLIASAFLYENQLKEEKAYEYGKKRLKHFERNKPRRQEMTIRKWRLFIGAKYPGLRKRPEMPPDRRAPDR